MFSFKSYSRKLKCALMGFSLGLAAVFLYLGFLLAHQVASSDQMVLIPVQLEVSTQRVK